MGIYNVTNQVVKQVVAGMDISLVKDDQCGMKNDYIDKRWNTKLVFLSSEIWTW